MDRDWSVKNAKQMPSEYLLWFKRKNLESARVTYDKILKELLLAEHKYSIFLYQNLQIGCKSFACECKKVQNDKIISALSWNQFQATFVS